MEGLRLTGEERRFLLKVARESIGAKLHGKRGEDISENEIEECGPCVKQPCGCFVTLHREGALKGCIGIFEGRGPLWKNVADMAAQAAFHDPRFSGITKDELAQIDIEISVLSPLREIDSIDEIEAGLHGLYITNGMNRGVLLPQVALEQGWNRDAFLEHTCMKAGLAPGAWKHKDTVIEVFTADVFGEKEPRYECP